ncbi:MAG TPA: DNA gyrase/topoisomerase IV subunit A [Flammeovirgaceae bacterium]|nr:DNA gyrase/topoisomerase IV subunit A [Flammeovirgaceae bacterium]
MSEQDKMNGQQEEGQLHDVVTLSGLYENWFLDYASYVILERAVPDVRDGLKPVQRRILHAMKEMDDGRFNKVANIIGQAMQYHPHGDAAIGDAIVNLGQKELLIDTQGNWGDIRTGDRAAAARYIEARLSKFALEVVFNPQTTEWQLSYDGRKKEPVALPVKFPLLLAQGVEGIAVGLSTKILPHNFNELIKASIDVLKGRTPKLYPDFPTGGLCDVSEYNRGQRGGRVKVRARIETVDKKQVVIRDIPYGTTTTGLIESIIKANDKGKIRIKKVVDNTAKDVEIVVHLAPGVSPEITIDALYAFTDCEISISPNACVIMDDKPQFLSVIDILRHNTQQTVELLTRELEIRQGELKEKLLFASLEKIFIENRIYRDIEECETWEAVISTIDQGLEPFKPQFYRTITEDDIVRLTEIKIKRISKYDSFKADELMKKLTDELAEVEHNLAHITDYAIAYFQKLQEKYGKGKERKTELTTFDSIKATAVVANNQKLYVNRKDGFIGYGLKKDEFVSECSDIDDIFVIRKDGKCLVTRIADKVYVGKNILYAGVWKKNDERMVYNLIYTDGKSGRTFVKRFNMLAATRDKEYDLTKGNKGSRILYVSANANGEAETVTIKLTSGCKARKKVFDFDFATIDIKGRGAGGNTLTKYPVRKVEFKAEGVSTLGGVDIWYDTVTGRLNRDQRGRYLGNFNGEDKIVVLYKTGEYEVTGHELTHRYEAEKVVDIGKLTDNLVVTAVYQDGDSKTHYVKRFQIETNTLDKRFRFIPESKGTTLTVATLAPDPVVEATLVKGKSKDKQVTTIKLNELIDVKGWKAVGNKFSPHKVKKIKILEVEDSSKNTDEKPTGTAAAAQENSTGAATAGVAVQASLFGEEELPPTKPVKAASKSKKKGTGASDNGKRNDDDDAFDIGATIELDL